NSSNRMVGAFLRSLVQFSEGANLKLALSVCTVVYVNVLVCVIKGAISGNPLFKTEGIKKSLHGEREV
ncbi:MAG: hypothetical protein AAGK05_18195, partial [Pseudomonadota bacterium]